MHSCSSLRAGRGSHWATCALTNGKLIGFVFFIAMALTLFLQSAAHASASDEVPIYFQNSTPFDGAWPVIERWMRGRDEDSSGRADFLEEHLNRLIELGEASDKTSALAYFQGHELYWALVDLDGDGIDEMLVYIDIAAYCGSIGCGTLELHRIWDGWQVRDGITMQNRSDLCYRRDGPDGHPLFRTSSEVFWWTGSRFDGVCYAYCSHWWDRDAIDPDELAKMTPEELAVRNETRKEPWCATGSPN